MEEDSRGKPLAKKHKKYLIALEETRSIVALIASILIFLCTLASVFIMIGETEEGGESALHFFTVLSNLLSAAGAAFMLPFAVEGIRKKRFVLPRWLVVFQYAGAASVAITMVSFFLLILPTQGMGAWDGISPWLHIVTPTATVILFQCVETRVTFRRRDLFLSLIPFWTYAAVYSVMVVFIGKERGGWNDFYLTMAFWSPWISFFLMLALGFAVSLLLFVVHNKHAAQSLKRISKAWSDDLEPTELLIEAFGLGRYIGSRCPPEELTVPLDIFAAMEERFGISVERLTKAYVKGALGSLEERKAGGQR